MTLRLVKTVGGMDGAPKSCKACGKGDFIRTRIAWNCGHCGSYVPINLDAPNAAEKLKRDLEVLSTLHKEFKLAIDSLERIVKK